MNQSSSWLIYCEVICSISACLDVSIWGFRPVWAPNWSFPAFFVSEGLQLAWWLVSKLSLFWWGSGHCKHWYRGFCTLCLCFSGVALNLYLVGLSAHRGQWYRAFHMCLLTIWLMRCLWLVTCLWLMFWLIVFHHILLLSFLLAQSPVLYH
jgi:hypothetical protein